MNWNKKPFLYLMLPLAMTMSVQLFCSCDDDNPYAISNDDATIQTRAITAQAGKKLEEVEEILLSRGDTVRVACTFNIDGKSVYSVKTFVPNIIIKTDGSARPHNWQLRELENKGYV